MPPHRRDTAGAWVDALARSSANLEASSRSRDELDGRTTGVSGSRPCATTSKRFRDWCRSRRGRAEAIHLQTTRLHGLGLPASSRSTAGVTERRCSGGHASCRSRGRRRFSPRRYRARGEPDAPTTRAAMECVPAAVDARVRHRYATCCLLIAPGSRRTTTASCSANLFERFRARTSVWEQRYSGFREGVQTTRLHRAVPRLRWKWSL